MRPNILDILNEVNSELASSSASGKLLFSLFDKSVSDAYRASIMDEFNSSIRMARAMQGF
jgi:hypothetical protein